MRSKQKKDALNEVRRIAIDILQAGNYIQAGKHDRAIYNIREDLESLTKLIDILIEVHGRGDNGNPNK